jgi:hypothetical protein
MPTPPPPALLLLLMLLLLAMAMAAAVAASAMVCRRRRRKTQGTGFCRGGRYSSSRYRWDILLLTKSRNEEEEEPPQQEQEGKKAWLHPAFKSSCFARFIRILVDGSGGSISPAKVSGTIVTCFADYTNLLE